MAATALQELHEAVFEPEDNGSNWRRGHATNLVGLPAAYLASQEFNDAAPPLHVAGARETNHHLFGMLDRCETSEAATVVFEDYMAVVFGLHPEQRAAGEGGRRRYRSSYRRLLRGWAYDSNGAEAAVLKGWVESRFGLFPTYHKGPITRLGCPEWVHYVEEKMSSRFHNNAITGQLDLLYEFAQWSLRRTMPAQHHVRLYRGVNGFDEHYIVRKIDRRKYLVRLNNTVSMTFNRDMASWFGDYILEMDVPTCKIIFYQDLLSQHCLKGEGEFLVIGGDYLVTARYD